MIDEFAKSCWAERKPPTTLIRLLARVENEELKAGRWSELTRLVDGFAMLGGHQQRRWTGAIKQEGLEQYRAAFGGATAHCAS
ncbi:hypothetical protein [Streptomyces sp. NPDC058872]|uniref:hypothetical protein n=1 Tax=Streptomyces sp. NPDC058872 TaxID=3346661 RepID=UPI003686EF0E